MKRLSSASLIAVVLLAGTAVALADPARIGRNALEKLEFHLDMFLVKGPDPCEMMGNTRGVYLDGYHAGLQQAAIRYLAVRWGWQSVLVFAGLSEDDRQRAGKRVNAVEEKLVRCETALMYAVKDLDGSKYREKQQAVRDARAAGNEAKADAVLANVFDSQFFYPMALKDVMSKGA